MQIPGLYISNQQIDIMMFSCDDLMREDDYFYFGFSAGFGQEGLQGEAYNARGGNRRGPQGDLGPSIQVHSEAGAPCPSHLQGVWPTGGRQPRLVG